MKMKDYIKQFYTEGFATTFYQKPKNYINKKVKNKKLAKLLNNLIKLFYTLIFVSIAVLYVYYKLK